MDGERMEEQIQDRTAVRVTLDYLRLCRAARAVGHPVAFTTDPAWLVDMAINRRAGWPDDPSEYRGSARPVSHRDRPGYLRYPRKAEGMAFHHLKMIVGEIHDGVVVRVERLGEWRKLLIAKIPQRLTFRKE
jgi:hypothetical protein